MCFIFHVSNGAWTNCHGLCFQTVELQKKPSRTFFLWNLTKLSTFFYFQIIASIVTCSFYIVIGIALSFSAFFIPQVERPDSDLKVTQTESAWIASVVVLMGPVASISSGMIMEHIGRLNTIKLASIPAIVGWALMATAVNVPMVIIGRMLTGLGCGKSWKFLGNPEKSWEFFFINSGKTKIKLFYSCRN